MLSNYINTGSMLAQTRSIKDTLGVDFRTCDNCEHMMLLEEAYRVLKVLKKFITTNYPSIFK